MSLLTAARLAAYEPEPTADSGFCGTCPACAAIRRVGLHACGCPASAQTPRGCSPSPLTIDPSVPRTGFGPAAASCLHALGRLLAHAAYYRAGVSTLPVLRLRAVLAQAVAMSADRTPRRQATALEAAGLTMPQALTLVVSTLRSHVTIGDLSEQTVDKAASHLGSLVLFTTDGLNGWPLRR